MGTFPSFSSCLVQYDNARALSTYRVLSLRQAIWKASEGAVKSHDVLLSAVQKYDIAQKATEVLKAQVRRAKETEKAAEENVFAAQKAHGEDLLYLKKHGEFFTQKCVSSQLLIYS